LVTSLEYFIDKNVKNDYRVIRMVSMIVKLIMLVTNTSNLCADNI